MVHVSVFCLCGESKMNFVYRGQCGERGAASRKRVSLMCNLFIVFFYLNLDFVFEYSDLDVWGG